MPRVVDKETLICEKLIEMMEDTSFFDIKVTDFVKFAGVSRSMFYLYFNSLYDVLQKIEDDFIDGLLSEKEVVSSTKIKRDNKIDSTIIAKTEYIKKNKKILRVLTGKNGDPSFSARMTNRNWRLLKNSLDDNMKYSENEKRLLAEYMSAGQSQALYWWVNRENAMDIYDVLLFIESITMSLVR
jgi:AcrR family transcriptional regulator